MTRKGGQAAYETLITELRKISANARHGPQPRLYNYHLFRPTPFHPSTLPSPNTSNLIHSSQVFKASIMTERDVFRPTLGTMYASKGAKGFDVGLQSNVDELESVDDVEGVDLDAVDVAREGYTETSQLHTQPQTQSVSQPPTETPTKYLNDIPLPHTLLHHTLNPSSPLLPTQSPLQPLIMQPLKITGLRMELKGRRGLRAMKQIWSYGKLDSGSFGGGAGGGWVDFGRATLCTNKGTTGVKIYVGYGK